MAQVIALRAAFGRLGFTNAAALRLTNDQQMDSLDEISLLQDEEVHNLCDVIRKPGGMIENPNAVDGDGNVIPGQPIPGQPTKVQDHGTQVSLRAETNLKSACYYLRHLKRTSRTPTAAGITLPVFRRLNVLRAHEEDYENPEERP